MYNYEHSKLPQNLNIFSCGADIQGYSTGHATDYRRIKQQLNKVFSLQDPRFGTLYHIQLSLILAILDFVFSTEDFY